jgi:hypothetical protein
MDGVLCDFYNHTRTILGYSWDDPRFGTKERRVERGKILSSVPNFWSHMPPESGFHELWDFLKPFEPSILTAYPEWDDKGACKGKWEWNEKWIHVPRHKFHCVERASKQYFAKEHDGSHFGKANLLIDDMPQNILEWTRRGGIGVLHKNAADTINRLRHLGFKHD